MSRWKRRFWTKQKPHAKNGHWKRDAIMRLLWYNHGFVAGWRVSNMNEGYCKLSIHSNYSFAICWRDHSYARLDWIWTLYCPRTVPKGWPVTSISNHARPSTIVRVAFCQFSTKNHQRTLNDWNVSVATCLPRSNRIARNSVTLASHWTKNWASRGFDTLNCCCTNAAFAWKNWNQVSSSIHFVVIVL